MDNERERATKLTLTTLVFWHKSAVMSGMFELSKEMNVTRFFELGLIHLMPKCATPKLAHLAKLGI